MRKIGFTAFMSSESTQPSYEELLSENEQLRSELAAVREREQKLQRLLKRDSTNSSQPPCTHAVRRVLIAWRDHRARRIDEARYKSIVRRCRRRIEAERDALGVRRVFCFYLN
ncbi:MAG: hypothetical protein GY822_00440 [Deltaproteobacteria bacterium]|nr:hypothetical protein [Deltaproteobacteria bacterium]